MPSKIIFEADIKFLLRKLYNFAQKVFTQLALVNSAKIIVADLCLVKMCLTSNFFVFLQAFSLSKYVLAGLCFERKKIVTCLAQAFFAMKCLRQFYALTMSQQISLVVIMFTILFLYVYSFTAKLYALYFLADVSQQPQSTFCPY